MDTYNDDHLLFNDDKTENAKGTVIGNGDQEFIFKGTQTLSKGTYLMKGWIYVGTGSVLTIEPGTVIKGDKDTQAALIVEPGGKLIAEGTKDAPIVFTSEQPKGQRKPGDWGGLIICGNAKNNQGVLNQQIEGGPRTKHGGNDDADNSGILRYVRVEFAGYPFQKDKEINGITFGSVGSGTTIDHLQVSYSNDDSYEWFGGNVNCKYLVAYNGWDDEFDTDNGFSGKVQYCLSIRDPRIADTSQSNGFESDNCGDASLIEPYTTAVFSNVTFIGPLGVMEMEKDQWPQANRNWIALQRWLDVSNDTHGVTWCALDAPLFEYGDRTANISLGWGGQGPWLTKLEPSSTVYSWAMNNHWHTNFPPDAGRAGGFPLPHPSAWWI